jgi:hypothetical protein
MTSLWLALALCLSLGCGEETAATVHVPANTGPTFTDGSSLFKDAGAGRGTTGAEVAGQGDSAMALADAAEPSTGPADAGGCDKPCDDGLPCTKDKCKNGYCIVKPVAGFCIVQGKCLQEGVVAGQLCRVCDPGASIFGLKRADAGACDDGNACTVNDKCNEGECVGDIGPGCCKSNSDCPSGGECLTGLCNTATGQCTTQPQLGCCVSGPCCDAATKTPKQSGAACGTVPLKVQWACAGQQVRQQLSYPGCDGADGSTCSTNPAFATTQAWKTVTTCPSATVCLLADSKTKPTCGKQTSGCTSDNACSDAQNCTIDICSAGACVHNAAPKGTVCGASKDLAQYQCHPQISGYIQVRYAAQTCNGTSACPAADGKVWGAWLQFKSCGSGDCKAGASAAQVPTCVAPLKCKPGSKCCDKDGNYATKATACSTTKAKSEFRCSGVIGGKIESRDAFAGCSGNSTFCSASFSDQVSWTKWAAVKTCPSDHKCEVSYNKTSAKCVDAKDCSPATTCCDAKGFYAVVGTKCGTSAYKTEYKCEIAGAKGSAILKRVAYKGCTGKSTWCSSTTASLAWGAWAKDGTCSAAQACKDSNFGGKPTCSTKTDCSAGATCCSKDGIYLPKATACGIDVLKTETRCVAGAAKIEERKAYPGCAGNSTSCFKYSTSYYAWTGWATKYSCPAGATCKESFSGAKCEGAKTACTAGKTCCTPAGSWAKVATQCGNYAYKTEYKCTSADKGGKVLHRKGYGGCTGSSSTCSSSVANLAWTAWGDYKQCAKYEVCSASKYSGTCKDVSKCLPSGKCCTEDGEYAKAATKCGTWPTESAYKCSSADKGAEILVQEVFTGCSGASGYSCSTKPTDYFSAPWKSYKKCSASMYCKVTEFSKSCATKP